ncbi:hypothetical protein OE749_12245 [Aestuariibacter sp. AA17]|uniref:Flagellar protein FliT n=1 Tax=Fluctibacter corallii TaxID=2984329 RepID=A0ABT3AAX8_9ALTE|nr:hypothetical protein [Aestuariibacter sp. AA17]MCV2885466.1 hypothetical protein [Aestuariibacter sp. AA17]
MKINLHLDHDSTPDSLRIVNQEIYEALELEEVDEASVLSIIEKRHHLIESILASLPEAEKREFAKSEMQANKVLTEHVKSLLSESLSSIASLKRGQKAVKKYR